MNERLRAGRPRVPRAAARTPLKFLRLAVRSDPLAAATAIVLTLAAAFTPAAGALSVSIAVSNMRGNVATVILSGCFVGGALALQFVVNRLQAHLRDDLARHLELELKEDLLHLLSGRRTAESWTDPAFLDAKSAVEGRVSELAEYPWQVVELASSVLALGASVLLLLDVQKQVAVLACFAAVPLAARSLGRRIEDAAARRVATAERQAHLLEAISSVEGGRFEILLGRGMTHVESQIAALRTQMDKGRSRAESQTFLIMVAGWFLYAAAVAASIVTIFAVLPPSARIGAIAIVSSLILRLKSQVSSTASAMTRVGAGARAAAHFRVLESGMLTAHGRGRPPGRLREGIALRAVNYRAPHSDAHVLRDVSVDLPAGSRICVVGLNGSGKSTLAHLLLGLLERSSGDFRIDGVPFGDLDPARWYERCSVITQDFAKPRLLVSEAVGLPQPELMGDVAELEAAFLRSGNPWFLSRLPGGTEADFGAVDQSLDVSEGQWQQVAIARSLIRKQPLLLVLDEPGSALDYRVELSMIDSFNKESKRLGSEFGTISIVISHRFVAAVESDLVLVMRDGQVDEYGTHGELYARNSYYREIIEQQRVDYRL